METIHKKFIKHFWSGTIKIRIQFAIGKETADKKKKKPDVKCKNKISNLFFFLNQRIFNKLLTIISCIFSRPNTRVYSSLSIIMS